MRTLIAFCLVTSASLAFAGDAPKQNHHCKMSDGTMDMAKTKKECKTAKGTWAKDAADDKMSADAKPMDAKPMDTKPMDPKPAATDTSKK